MSADRVSKIGRIMPEFTRAAAVGDEVTCGLRGDPLNPYGANPPKGVVTKVHEHPVYGRTLTITKQDGTSFTCDKTTTAPNRVIEFTDASFRGVLAREQSKYAGARAGGSSSEDSYRGSMASMQQQIADVAQKQQDFQNMFLRTVYELANDNVQNRMPSYAGSSRANGFSEMFVEKYRNSMERFGDYSSDE